MDTFSFLPGHRKLLLTLSDKVKLFLNPIQRTQYQLQNTAEEVELFSDEEVVVLKKKLFDKLNSSVSTIEINKKFTEDNLIGSIDAFISQSRFSHGKPTYKCFLKCVECEKSIPCTFIGYWQISNLERHLKSHIK